MDVSIKFFNKPVHYHNLIFEMLLQIYLCLQWNEKRHPYIKVHCCTASAGFYAEDGGLFVPA